jgi:hypothetical protein
MGEARSIRHNPPIDWFGVRNWPRSHQNAHEGYRNAKVRRSSDPFVASARGADMTHRMNSLCTPDVGRPNCAIALPTRVPMGGV